MSDASCLMSILQRAINFVLALSVRVTASSASLRGVLRSGYKQRSTLSGLQFWWDGSAGRVGYGSGTVYREVRSHSGIVIVASTTLARRPLTRLLRGVEFGSVRYA